ncbi:MAG: DUF1150 family protein [Sphingomonadales bacterium]
MNASDLKNMSQSELAQLGAPFLVYIRPVEDQLGRRQFAIHAADGQPLGLIDSYQEALEAAASNHLQPVTLH